MNMYMHSKKFSILFNTNSYSLDNRRYIILISLFRESFSKVTIFYFLNPISLKKIINLILLSISRRIRASILEQVFSGFNI